MDATNQILTQRAGTSVRGASLCIAAAVLAGCASVSRLPDQTYYGASSNWSFRHRYPATDRLFNAFERLLVHPPALPLEEHAIGPTYTTVVPELLAVFDWAHMLHRQLYHWYQLAVYDALLGAPKAAGQRRNLDSATAHFWALISEPPARMPTAAAVSPRLAARYPEMAIISDNLHSLRCRRRHSGITAGAA